MCNFVVLEKLSFFLPNCTWNPFITYTYAVRFEKSCSDWWTRDCVVTLYNQPVLSNQNTVPFIFKKGFTRKKFLLLPLPPLHVTLKPTLSNLVTHVFLKYTKVVFSSNCLIKWLTNGFIPIIPPDLFPPFVPLPKSQYHTNPKTAILRAALRAVNL